MEKYEISDFSPVYWVEAIPKYVEISRKLLVVSEKQSVIEAAHWSSAGIRKKFRISSNGGLSSSFYKMKPHRVFQPSNFLIESIRVRTTTIDKLVEDLRIAKQCISLLVLDLQGVELEVLKGAKKTLQQTNAIFCEVSRMQLYKKQPTFKMIDEFLMSEGFVLAEHDLVGENYSGDALYLRRDLV